MKVSICIPTRNRCDLLHQAIESVLNQKFEDMEILICDDASHDATESVVRNIKDERIRYYKNEYRLGYVSSMNKLTDLAKGEYVMYLSDDDLLMPDLISTEVGILESNTDVGMVMPASGLIDFNGNWMFLPPTRQKILPLPGKHMIFNFLPDFKLISDVYGRRKFHTSFPSTMFRKQLVTRVGKFDPDVKIACDLLLQSKICLISNVVYIDRLLFKYRIHDNWGTMQSKNSTYIDEFVTLFSKLMEFILTNNIKLDYDFNIFKKRFAKYMLSINGGVPRICARYDGSYFEKALEILHVFSRCTDMYPGTCLDPEAWLVCIIGILTPRMVANKFEKVYWSTNFGK